MKKALLFYILIFPFLIITGCDKDPVNRLVNPSPASSTGVWSGTWVLYDDELKTNGAVMTFNEGATIDFNCTDNPRSGKKCIRYSWNGSPVLTYASPPSQPVNYTQSGFSGFSLICAQTLGAYSTQTRNLALGGDTKITFWARGSLNANVYLRVEANFPSTATNVYELKSGATGVWMGVPSSTWTQYSLTIDPTVNNLAATDFVKFILLYDEDGNPDTPNTSVGNGGTVFLDDIELTR